MSSREPVSIRPAYDAIQSVVEQLDELRTPEAARDAAILRGIQLTMRAMCVAERIVINPPPPAPAFFMIPPGRPGER